MALLEIGVLLQIGVLLRDFLLTFETPRAGRPQETSPFLRPNKPENLSPY